MNPIPATTRPEEIAAHPLLFKVVRLQPGGAAPQESHASGQFVHAISGVIEVGMNGQIFLAPPQYGVWIPPGVAHVSHNRQAASYATLYVAPPLSDALPRTACTMVINPLIKAVLDVLRNKALQVPHTESEHRLFHVLLDQLVAAPSYDSYLPMSQDPLLGRVLAELLSSPADTRTLSEWAVKVHSTERTLARRCERDLHMPFNEWRQRLKVVHGIALLEAGHAVKDVALELGYSAPSAFIAMFQRQVGMTPQAYAAQNCSVP